MLQTPSEHISTQIITLKAFSVEARVFIVIKQIIHVNIPFEQEKIKH